MQARWCKVVSRCVSVRQGKGSRPGCGTRIDVSITHTLTLHRNWMEVRKRSCMPFSGDSVATNWKLMQKLSKCGVMGTRADLWSLRCLHLLHKKQAKHQMLLPVLKYGLPCMLPLDVPTLVLGQSPVGHQMYLSVFLHYCLCYSYDRARDSK